jgi:N-acetylglucosamine malate deacetylase 1
MKTLDGNTTPPTPPRAFAIAAHPDDIEFGMAGTLILLGQAGCELHVMHIANGSCGSTELPPFDIARIRGEEAEQAARLIGAHYHPSLVDDIDILYTKPLLAQVGAVIRLVAPDILLVPSPQDYMEDHAIACRLAVTAAFCRGMPNYPTDPPRPAVGGSVTVYHAQPHGNRDPLGNIVKPELVVDIQSVIARKRAMLECHQSQKRWLDATQGMDSYVNAMEAFGRDVGRMSGAFEVAEGWRRHLHYGFCGEHDDPLRDSLGAYCT